MVARWFSSRQHALGEFVSSNTVGFDDWNFRMYSTRHDARHSTGRHLERDRLGTQDGITLGGPLGDDELGF